MPSPLPKSSPLPFHLPGTRGSALLLHGFTGTPYELRPLADALHQAGFTCLAPLLPGHGETTKHLNESSAEYWESTAKEAFLSLPTDKPRIVIGFSMGGLLASVLTAEHNDQIDKLVLISPAFHLRFYGKIASCLAKWHIGHSWFIPKRLKGGDILDPQARSQNPTYGHIPFKALVELDRLRQKATFNLPQITCPTLALFGIQDHTVHPQKTAKLLQHRLVSPYHQCFFQNSAHIVPLDFNRDELIAQILFFCESNVSSKTSDQPL